MLLLNVGGDEDSVASWPVFFSSWPSGSGASTKALLMVEIASVEVVL